MEENKNQNGSSIEQERTYTQNEVNAIVRQYQIQLEQIKKSAAEEIGKRDLSNFYQTLSILFEIVRNRDAYSSGFVNKTIDAIERGVNNIFEEDNGELKKDE